MVSLMGMIAFWSTLSLNMPDFTRYGRSQREQVVGQVVALPTTMTLFAAMGVVIPHDDPRGWNEGIMTNAVFDFDDDGLVVDYPPGWKRRAP